MLVRDGATLGGLVGPGCSTRAFPLRRTTGFCAGCQVCSGDGEVINAGGKVVKNAAGFDILLLVGSIGRLMRWLN